MQSDIPKPAPTNAVIARKTSFELLGFRFIINNQIFKLKSEIAEKIRCRQIDCNLTSLNLKIKKKTYRPSCNANESKNENSTEKCKKVERKPRWNIR
jgi:hypothetical protein